MRDFLHAASSIYVDSPRSHRFINPIDWIDGFVPQHSAWQADSVLRVASLEPTRVVAPHDHAPLPIWQFVPGFDTGSASHGTE